MWKDNRCEGDADGGKERDDARRATKGQQSEYEREKRDACGAFGFGVEHFQFNVAKRDH